MQLVYVLMDSGAKYINYKLARILLFLREILLE